MSNNFVTRLRQMADRCDHGYPNWGEGFYPAPVHCNTCIIYREVASEIERLRKAGDSIAMHLDAHYGIGNQAPDWIKDDLAEWKEASCG